MTLPALIVTGASGFIGRHLLDRLKERYRIYGIARRSQRRSGAPIHPNVTWFQVDIADRASLEHAFRRIGEEGGADTVVHLAAHYDFTGIEVPEYQRTNVDGLRNVLECSRELGIKHLVFSSSVAACQFPSPGRTVDETSPPTGDHIYAKTKAIGEEMVKEYEAHFSSVIVRFAALFSDWCEYPPLFKFLETWLSSKWNQRILAGKGQSAIPYLHVLDGIDFLQRLLKRLDETKPGQIVVCSGDGSTTHLELFVAATHYHFGEYIKAIFMPRPLVKPGVHVRCLIGRMSGEMPFERPWMVEYIDERLDIDATNTREWLGWEPKERREIIRRLPFLLENRKVEPVEWIRRNHAAMKQYRVRPNLQIHSLLGAHAEEISAEYTRALEERAHRGDLPSYGHVTHREHEWNHKLILRHLMNAVLTQERGVFISYCRDLAERRFDQGYKAHELASAVQELGWVCLRILGEDEEGRELVGLLHGQIMSTVLFGCDEVYETFETLEASRPISEAAPH